MRKYIQRENVYVYSTGGGGWGALGKSSREVGGGGGHSGIKWTPTAKWLSGAEAVSTKIEGRSAPFK